MFTQEHILFLFSGESRENLLALRRFNFLSLFHDVLLWQGINNAGELVDLVHRRTAWLHRKRFPAYQRIDHEKNESGRRLIQKPKF